eukprot:8303929-Alexandrium_andersonii.AAC.1
MAHSPMEIPTDRFSPALGIPRAGSAASSSAGSTFARAGVAVRQRRSGRRGEAGDEERARGQGWRSRCSLRAW